MPFELLIVTPQGPAYSGRADVVVLPGSEGDFGVLPSHERLLAPLRIGEVEIRSGGEVIYAAIAAGFAEVNGSEVVVMVESCESASEVDVARAELAQSRAAAGLAELGEDAHAKRIEEFEATLARARNRISLAQRRQP